MLEHFDSAAIRQRYVQSHCFRRCPLDAVDSLSYRRGPPDDIKTREGSQKLNQFLASLSCVFNDEYVHANGSLQRRIQLRGSVRQQNSEGAENFVRIRPTNTDFPTGRAHNASKSPTLHDSRGLIFFCFQGVSVKALTDFSKARVLPVSATGYRVWSLRVFAADLLLRASRRHLRVHVCRKLFKVFFEQMGQFCSSISVT